MCGASQPLSSYLAIVEQIVAVMRKVTTSTLAVLVGYLLRMSHLKMAEIEYGAIGNRSAQSFEKIFKGVHLLSLAQLRLRSCERRSVAICQNRRLDSEYQ